MKVLRTQPNLTMWLIWGPAMKKEHGEPPVGDAPVCWVTTSDRFPFLPGISLVLRAQAHRLPAFDRTGCGAAGHSYVATMPLGRALNCQPGPR